MVSCGYHKVVTAIFVTEPNIEPILSVSNTALCLAEDAASGPIQVYH